VGVGIDMAIRGSRHDLATTDRNIFNRHFCADELDLDDLAQAIRELLQSHRDPAKSDLLSLPDRATYVSEAGTP
jgi:hypothetical protein